MSILLKQTISKAGYYEEREPEAQFFKEKMNIMNQYRKENHLCDVVLLIGDREFPAHRAILSASSKFFEGLFASHMKEATEQKVFYNKTASVNIDMCDLRTVVWGGQYVI